MTLKRSERRRYTKEFKKETVELLLNSNKTAVVLSGELGIRTEVLYRWKREYLNQKEYAFPGTGHINETSEEKEIRLLKKEKRDIEEERDILKKALAIFSKGRL